MELNTNELNATSAAVQNIIARTMTKYHGDSAIFSPGKVDIEVTSDKADVAEKADCTFLTSAVKWCGAMKVLGIDLLDTLKREDSISRIGVPWERIMERAAEKNVLYKNMLMCVRFTTRNTNAFTSVNALEFEFAPKASFGRLGSSPAVKVLLTAKDLVAINRCAIYLAKDIEI